MISKKTKQLTLDAMLAAMCAVLGYISLDMGNLKITFESLPILLGAFLFGPMDGLAIGGVGTLIYQLLRYGISATTVLWILPYVLLGLLVGAVSRKWLHRSKSPARLILFTVILGELMVTALNTGVIYIDSKIYGYYSAAYVFGSLGIRLVICIGKSVVFGLILPSLLKPLRRFSYDR